MKPIIIIYEDANGGTDAQLFLSPDDIHSFFWTPSKIILYELPLKITGNSYAERKESARSLAIDYSIFRGHLALTWGEYAYISTFFEKVGKRYGLLNEFRENAIC